MKRYHVDEDGCENEAEDGDYYRVEDVDPIIADRDIKAANLQKLVDAVLTFETQDSAFQVAPEIRELWDGLFDLARGLKQ